MHNSRTLTQDTFCNYTIDRDNWYDRKNSHERANRVYTPLSAASTWMGAKIHPFIQGYSFCSWGREHCFRHASDSSFIVPSGALSSSNVARPWGESLEIAFRAKHVRRQLDDPDSGYELFHSDVRSPYDNLSHGSRTRYFRSYNSKEPGNSLNNRRFLLEKNYLSFDPRIRFK